jgi:hypothetical protein
MWACLRAALPRVTAQLKTAVPAASVLLAAVAQTNLKADPHVCCAPKHSSKRVKTSGNAPTFVQDRLAITQRDPGVAQGSHLWAGWRPELLASLRAGSPFRCLTG